MQDTLLALAAGLLGITSVEEGDLLPRLTMHLLAPGHRCHSTPQRLTIC